MRLHAATAGFCCKGAVVHTLPQGLAEPPHTQPYFFFFLSKLVLHLILVGTLLLPSLHSK